ncbi:MAG: DUF1697 domain-containing protein [Chloroflexi bacterium]|nr:DUF1697 domain-containing protein [Chloroflexota bacterium]
MQYAAFLRAINVGTANRIRMDDLRAVCAAAGFGDVRTYLQSGNLVFESPDPEEAVAARLEDALAGRGLKNASAMVRARDELAEILAACPSDAYEPERFRRYVTFFRAPVPGPLGATVAGSAAGVVTVCLREVFTVVPMGEPGGVDINGLLGRKLGVPSTTRYWNVAEAVLALCDQ